MFVWQMTYAPRNDPHKTQKPTQNKKQDENMDHNYFHILYKHVSYCLCIQTRTEASLIKTLNIKQNTFEIDYDYYN